MREKKWIVCNYTFSWNWFQVPEYNFLSSLIHCIRHLVFGFIEYEALVNFFQMETGTPGLPGVAAQQLVVILLLSSEAAAVKLNYMMGIRYVNSTPDQSRNRKIAQDYQTAQVFL